MYTAINNKRRRRRKDQKVVAMDRIIASLLFSHRCCCCCCYYTAIHPSERETRTTEPISLDKLRLRAYICLFVLHSLSFSFYYCFQCNVLMYVDRDH